MAPPPPLVTFGAPTTAPRGGAELGLGAGTGASLFPGAHAAGNGWFGRVRYGLTNRLDLGGDIVGDQGSQSVSPGLSATPAAQI
jgi:hypothetical protein